MLNGQFGIGAHSPLATAANYALAALAGWPELAVG